MSGQQDKDGAAAPAGQAKPRKRRSRDPVATREAILDAAQTLLAKYGPDAISLSEVAKLAGVNRGTAYQHFKTRENLIEATVDAVSEKLFTEVFGEPDAAGKRQVEATDIADLTDRIASFAMQNPELCRIWLLRILSSPKPLADPFWREYAGSLARWSETELAEPGIDSEVLSLMTLAGSFLWPVWKRAQTLDEDERAASARRFADECLRFSMYGSVKEDHYPQIAERLKKAGRKDARLRAVGGK